MAELGCGRKGRSSLGRPGIQPAVWGARDIGGVVFVQRCTGDSRRVHCKGWRPPPPTASWSASRARYSCEQAATHWKWCNQAATHSGCEQSLRPASIAVSATTSRRSCVTVVLRGRTARLSARMQLLPPANRLRPMPACKRARALVRCRRMPGSACSSGHVAHTLWPTSTAAMWPVPSAYYPVAHLRSLHAMACPAKVCDAPLTTILVTSSRLSGRCW